MTTCSLRKLFSAFALVVVTLYASLASADEPERGAVHRGTVDGESIVWRSHFQLNDGASTVRLASPLPNGSSIEKNEEVAPVVENGQIAAFAAKDPMMTTMTVVLHEPLPRTRDRVHLTIPFAESDAVQVVDVGGPGGLHFEPGAASSLERRVGYYAFPGFAKRSRAERDATLGYRKRQAGDLPLYVRVTPELASGIDGTLSTEATRTRTGAIGAGVIFAGMIVALGVAYRRMAGAARFEESERALEEEFARMETRA